LFYSLSVTHKQNVCEATLQKTAGVFSKTLSTVQAMGDTVPETSNHQREPRVCELCGKVVRGSGGLGGHMAWHNRKDGKPAKPRRRKSAAYPVVTKPPRAYTNPVMDAVDVCSTVLQAMNPNGILPHHKIRPFFNWIKATETFFEEMKANGNDK